MKCPNCEHDKSQVEDSRVKADGIRRRRKCAACGTTWTTLEFTVATCDQTRGRDNLTHAFNDMLMRRALEVFRERLGDAVQPLVDMLEQDGTE